MQDVFAYCAELVRAADHDRYLATLFAPGSHRGALFALYAFANELKRVREVAREPLPGEIRLQWWSEVLGGERDGEASANPVASALLQTIARHRLDPAALIDIVEAYRFDLYDEPLQTIVDLEGYARRTSSALITLAAKILCGSEMAEARQAGIAYAIAALARALPLHASRAQLYVPLEVLERHGVQTSDVYAGRPSRGLNAALAELRDLARIHLAAVRQSLSELPPDALPAFLPVTLVGPSLRRLDRRDAFSPVEIPPWRRQWLIWRAAHNPGRIAR
ncbi:MAG: phytoene/squalene synthase family protein [Xanthobacteraceae bacterium]